MQSFLDTSDYALKCVTYIFKNSFHLLNLNIWLNRQLCINTCFMYFKNVWWENLCFGVLYFCSEHIILKDENFLTLLPYIQWD